MTANIPESYDSKATRNVYQSISRSINFYNAALKAPFKSPLLSKFDSETSSRCGTLALAGDVRYVPVVSKTNIG